MMTGRNNPAVTLPGTAEPAGGVVPVARALFAIVIVAASLRLLALESMPIFLDEDIYATALRHALDMDFAGGSLFYSSEAHKPFLLSWMVAAVNNVLGDFVLAGRLLAALAGIATTVICYQVGRAVRSPSTGLFCALLYATSPVAVLHERMFLHDPPMVAGATLAFWAALLAGRRRSWGWAAASALAGVFAVQFKQSAVLLAPVLPMAVALSAERGPDRRKFLTAVLAGAGPLLSFLALHFSAVGRLFAPANTRFDLLGNWQGNLSTLWDAAAAYLGLPVLLFAAAGLTVLLRRPGMRRTGVLLAGTVAFLALPWILASDFAPSRYFLPAVPFVFLFASVGIAAAFSACRERSGWVLLMPGLLALVSLVPPAMTAARCVWSLETAALPVIDDWQYRSGWPAGYGYREAGQALRAAAEPGDRVGYMIDRQHLNAAGFHEPPREGVEALGLLDRGWSPAGSDRATLLMVDQSRDERAEDPHPAEKIMLHTPGSVEIARFPKLGSPWSTVVLLFPGEGGSR